MKLRACRAIFCRLTAAPETCKLNEYKRFSRRARPFPFPLSFVLFGFGGLTRFSLGAVMNGRPDVTALPQSNDGGFHMTIIVLDGQGGGIGRAIISALLPLLPQGAQLLCVGTNAMATAAMLKAGAQRGATGENAVRWAAQNADILVAPIALVLKDSMMGEITGDMAASVGSSRATRILVPTERCGTHVAGAHGVSMQALVEDAARQAAAMAAGA